MGSRHEPFLHFCPSVCPSVNLLNVFLFVFNGKTSPPFAIERISSVVYMLEMPLGTVIHLIEVKWWSVKICFRAVADVILFAFHRDTDVTIPMKVCFDVLYMRQVRLG